MTDSLDKDTTTKIDTSYRHIILLAVPVLLANLFMPLQSTIDAAIVGHFSDASQLAGMGLAIQILSLLLVSFNFLQYASSGLSAQAVGKATTASQASHSLLGILQRSLLLALAIGMVLMLCQSFLIDLGLHLLAASEDSSAAATTYLRIRFFSVIAELMNYAFLGWFAGQGKTRLMLYQQSFIAIINIILTLTFVYIFDMGLAGVALGTACAFLAGHSTCFMDEQKSTAHTS